MRKTVAMILAASAWPAMAAAQQAPAPQRTPAPPSASADEGEEADIVVTGSRTLPGSTIGDIPPEQTLSSADVRAYGVSSVNDLLTELAPQTQSGVGGPPVVLLNGKRIAGFQEIRDIPTEAISRVEILPEEVALKYGYRADQKVVNIVLRRRFRATTIEATDRQATEGGRNTPQGELGILSIRNGGRVNLDAKYLQSSALTEAERDIAAQATEAGTPGFDQRPYRTLLPSARSLSLNAVYARPIGNVSATINGELGATSGTGLFGLPSATFTTPAGSVTRVLDGGAFGPLAQRNSSITTHVGATANGALGDWQWTLTGKYDRADSETFTDTGVDVSAFQARINAGDPTANPLGRLTAADVGALPANRGYSTSSTGAIDALVNGSLFALPAGKVSTSLHLGADTSDFSSRSYRAGLYQTGAVARDEGNAQLNVDLPIASRSKDVLGFLGTLSLSGNAGVNHLSDFGTLTTWGYGLNWAPIDGVRFVGSVSDQDEAPSAAQLGNPVITTPNVRVFDYVRGLTATVSQVSGGNPGLIADNRHVDKMGVTLKPWSAKDLTLTANYVATRVDDPIAAFPTPTAAIEAAFPDRFTRDAGGNLLRIDARPINFARSESSQLRWGINFSQPLKSRIQKQLEAFRAGTGPNPFAGMSFPGGGRPGGDGARPGGDGGPPPGGPGGPGAGGPGGGFRGGGFGGGRGGGQGGGRLQFALYHTWHLTDRVTVANGGPVLDLLNGDAIGASGGQSRHELEGQAGYTNNGLGARLSINYASGTRVNGGTAAAPQPLAFSALTTANLRLFADLGAQLDWVKAHPWLRGTRVSFSIDNLLNSRQRVTDATGTTPISYQPDYLDPLGRTVRLSVRKLFF